MRRDRLGPAIRGLETGAEQDAPMDGGGTYEEGGRGGTSAPGKNGSHVLDTGVEGTIQQWAGKVVDWKAEFVDGNSGGS